MTPSSVPPTDDVPQGAPFETADCHESERYCNVPQQLKRLPQGVTYEQRPKQGNPSKFDKIPRDAKTRRPAAVNRPDTFSAFDVARSRAQADPRLAGIGFVFTGRDPYAGIDIDGAIDLTTGNFKP